MKMSKIVLVSIIARGMVKINVAGTILNKKNAKTSGSPSILIEIPVTMVE